MAEISQVLFIVIYNLYPISSSCNPIELFHNGGQIKYSFVLMLISLTSLATTSKFQKNICFKTRAVGLINIKAKECESGRHLWKWPIRWLFWRSRERTPTLLYLIMVTPANWSTGKELTASNGQGFHKRIWKIAQGKYARWLVNNRVSITR